MSPTYLTTEELSQRVRTPIETIRYWRHIGKGPQAVKFGRRVLYPVDAVERWELEARAAANVA